MLAPRAISYSKSFSPISTICPALSFLRSSSYAGVKGTSRNLMHHTTMSASASQVKLSLDHCGVFHLPGVTKESADKASELLQENHEKHHVFFNQNGFHSKSANLDLLSWLYPLLFSFLTSRYRSYSSSHSHFVCTGSISQIYSKAL